MAEEVRQRAAPVHPSGAWVDAAAAAVAAEVAAAEVAAAAAAEAAAGGLLVPRVGAGASRLGWGACPWVEAGPFPLSLLARVALLPLHAPTRKSCHRC